MSVVDVNFAIVALLALLIAVVQVGRLIGSWRSDTSARIEPEADAEVVALRDRKVRLLEDLRDLDMDWRMGRLSDEDYRKQKGTLEPQAVSVLKELERRTGADHDDA